MDDPLGCSLIGMPGTLGAGWNESGKHGRTPYNACRKPSPCPISALSISQSR